MKLEDFQALCEKFENSGGVIKIEDKKRWILPDYTLWTFSYKGFKLDPLTGGELLHPPIMNTVARWIKSCIGEY